MHLTNEKTTEDARHVAENGRPPEGRDWRLDDGFYTRLEVLELSWVWLLFKVIFIQGASR